MKKDVCRRRMRPLFRVNIKMYGDWFVCTSCGYMARIRALGDTAHCSKCGGTMTRK